MNLSVLISAFGIDLPPGWDKFFQVFNIVAIIVLMVLAVALIVCVLVQSSTSGGVGAIGGQSTETFYSKNKGRTLQGVMKRLTVVLAISILVITVLYLISVQFYNPNTAI